MSEQAPGKGDPQIAAPTITRKRQNRISWIWLVPVVAALMGLSLVVRTWLQAGTDISITFTRPTGWKSARLRLRYKDVNVGTVKSIGFNEDRSKVVVTAELAKEVSDLARDGTNFWAVKPRLDVSGVSGLGTLLSGAYIGVDAIEGKGKASKATKLTFEGLEIPPAVTHDRTGKRFKLKADNLGSLDVGSPVYYRRINVGRVIGYELDKSGDSVNIEVRRRAERCVRDQWHALLEFQRRGFQRQCGRAEGAHAVGGVAAGGRRGVRAGLHGARRQQAGAG